MFIVTEYAALKTLARQSGMTGIRDKALAHSVCRFDHSLVIKASEYADQEIPQSQPADKTSAP